MWVLLGLSLAWADPQGALLAQRAAVEQAAAAVASARADGARRSELAELMRVYREAAAELDRLEQIRAPNLEQARLDRLAAMTALSRDLAEGQTTSPARALLVDWLGDPSARAAILADVVTAGLSAPTSVRRGLLLDVIEQADAVAVLLAFDAAALEHGADQLELRALSLRRRAGQAGSMAAEMEAARLEAEAAEATRQGEAWMQMRTTVLELRRTVATALEAP